MKECTRIITAQITLIEKIESEEVLAPLEQVKEVLKVKTCADDVNILQMQDFVMDQEGGKQE